MLLAYHAARSEDTWAMVRVWLLVFAVVAACAKAGQSSEIADAGDDGMIIDAPIDGAENCAVQPCDIVTQCGCGGAQACDIDRSDLMGSACRMITAQGHEMSACTAASDCDKQFVCVGAAGKPSCKKFCTSNADCVAPRGQCVIDVTNGGQPIPGAPSICSSNCDPTNSAGGGCPTGFKCGMFNATHGGQQFQIADCTGAVGTGVQGTVCTGGGTGDESICSANFSCTTLNGGASFQCRKICNKTANTGCGALTCIAFNPAMNIGGTEYGVCN
jgi:hypothetical protein